MFFEAYQPELASMEVSGAGSYVGGDPETRSAAISRQLYNYWKDTFAPLEDQLLQQATDPNAISSAQDLARENNDKAFEVAEQNADFKLSTYGAQLTPDQEKARERALQTQHSNSAIHAAAKAADDTTNRQEFLRSGVIGLGRDVATSASSELNQLDAQEQQRQSRNDQNEASAKAQRNSNLASAAIATAFLLSSKEAKKEIKPASNEDSMGVIRQIENKHWKYKDGMGPEGDFIGGIAEELPVEISDGTVVNMVNQSGHQTGAIQNIDERLQKLEAIAEGVV